MTNEGQWRALVASKQLEIDKLKLKCDDILKLRKDLDLAREETQLVELRYKTLKDAVDKAANDKLNKARGELND